MKILPWLALLPLIASCSGIKVMKEPPPAQKASKPGITFGSGGIGPVQVQKVGFWCDAKHGMMTFGAFGETEEKAKANAQDKCRSMFKDSSCEPVTCKPA